ncbi:MAG: PilW family protein [Burkholderiales bacterium]|jgi:type IV pilus assembly protein PilW|nr:PilW family protein [Burkholderiales bacterium]
MRIVTSRRREAGMTLIELMVGLLVGMLLTLAIFEVMATFEGRKRTLSSVNDIEHAGQLALYKIDSWLRSAGSGLPQSATYAYGCPVYASKSSVPILPLTKTLDAPFESVNPGKSGVFRAAPVLILPGQTTPGASGSKSDVLVVMAASGDSGTPVPFTESGVATSSSLDLQNTVDFSANDLVLVADQQSLAGGARKPCMVGQVSSTFTTGSAPPLALSGAYQAESATLTNYSSSTVAMKLGNVASGRTPLFMLLGVGDNNVLYSYDLLRINDDAPQAQAEGVFEMHAVYGVDTNNDGKIDAWVSPSTGNYALSVLSAGDQIAATRLAQIKAIRVGLILRTSLAEKDVAPNLPITLFADLEKLGLAYPRTLSDQEQHFRYRTLETTIPVRNNAF